MIIVNKNKNINNILFFSEFIKKTTFIISIKEQIQPKKYSNQ